MESPSLDRFSAHLNAIIVGFERIQSDSIEMPMKRIEPNYLETATLMSNASIERVIDSGIESYRVQPHRRQVKV